MMAHYRLVDRLLLGLVVWAVFGACSGSPQPTAAPPGPFILSGTGIAAAEIGEPPAAVVDELTGLLGAPDADSGWIAADSDLYGTCPAEQLRAVGWGSLFLYFVADEEVTADNEHIAGRFFTYSYGYDFGRNEGGTDPRELGLVTEADVGLGSTRSELRAAYGDDLTEAHDALTDIWSWEAAANQPNFLRGLLSGPEDDATVVLIERVPGCGNV